MSLQEKTMKKNLFCSVLICILLSSWTIGAEKTVVVPANKIALFSSGVGFFQHSGTIEGKTRIILEVPANAVNDILKSLIVNDESGEASVVEYNSADSEYKTLRSLKIDLSGNPGLPEILGGMTGETVVVHAPERTEGRIIGVESFRTGEFGNDHALLIATDGRMCSIVFSEISAIEFPDADIAADLIRALDILKKSTHADTKKIEIVCSGTGSRPVAFSYIIPVPVWKTTYRLDVSGEKALFQGWAIVDNGGDFDWSGVLLSLVTGRPVSFIQNLFDPHYVDRPVLPLSIAGGAPAVSYESGFKRYAEEAVSEAYSDMSAPAMAKSALSARDKVTQNSVIDSRMKTAAESVEAGEQFLFTVNAPITVPRQKSAMVPLFNEHVSTKRISVVSSKETRNGSVSHPMLCVEVDNTTGVKIPAGPVTVYDGNLYAGDALLDYLPENERRLIGYGEDLPVTVFRDRASDRELRTVKISRGFLVLSRILLVETSYHIKNSDKRERIILVEHEAAAGFELVSPKKPEEQTSSAYRFRFPVGSGAETVFTVKEEQPVEERIALSGAKSEVYLSYVSTAGIPERIQAALQKAAGFRQQWENAEQDLAAIEREQDDLDATQERIRLNLNAAGRDSQQGKEYLKKLAETDAAIELLSRRKSTAEKKRAEARSVYEAYISNLTLE